MFTFLSIQRLQCQEAQFNGSLGGGAQKHQMPALNIISIALTN